MPFLSLMALSNSAPAASQSPFLSSVAPRLLWASDGSNMSLVSLVNASAAPSRSLNMSKATPLLLRRIERSSAERATSISSKAWL